MRACCVLLIGLCSASAARADFVLQPDASARAPRAREPRALPTAVGFGDAVPLKYAVLQIVPAPWKVTYGPGVDGEREVDWKGGKPWDESLRDAVRPLKLRIVLRGGAVQLLP